MLKCGDIIQVTSVNHSWFPCLLMVDEVEDWGVKAYLIEPDLEHHSYKVAPTRIGNGNFVKVGKAYRKLDVLGAVEDENG